MHSARASAAGKIMHLCRQTITLWDDHRCLDYDVGEEEGDVDDNNFLVCDDFLGLLAIESAAEEQDWDNEHDGRQEIVR